MTPRIVVASGEAVVSLISVLDRQVTMVTYSAGNGLELAGLSLPTSCLKVPLDTKDIQNEGDLGQDILLPSPFHFSPSCHARHSC